MRAPVEAWAALPPVALSRKETPMSLPDSVTGSMAERKYMNALGDLVRAFAEEQAYLRARTESARSERDELQRELLAERDRRIQAEKRWGELVETTSVRVSQSMDREKK